MSLVNEWVTDEDFFKLNPHFKGLSLIEDIWKSDEVKDKSDIMWYVALICDVGSIIINFTLADRKEEAYKILHPRSKSNKWKDDKNANALMEIWYSLTEPAEERAVRKCRIQLDKLSLLLDDIEVTKENAKDITNITELIEKQVERYLKLQDKIRTGAVEKRTRGDVQESSMESGVFNPILQKYNLI